jgi:dihydroorotate dehydrogenase (fumarate)
MSVDLSTRYLGLKLSNPLVVAACPLTAQVDWLKRFEEQGAAAAVLPSLFEEQIVYEDEQLAEASQFGADYYAEHSAWFPEPADYRTGTQQYLDTIEKAKKAVSMPIVASLNGTTAGGWVQYGKMMQEAGADALELNIYFVAANPDETGPEVERRYTDLVAAVKQAVTIPLAVKIGPYFSSVGNFVRKLTEAGADGLVLFNRFLQPDIDLDAMETAPRLVLSTPFELLVPLRWVAILKGRVRASLAVTSGIHDAEGMAKALLVGADVGQVVSTIYLHGAGRLREILDGLRAWMAEKEYDSVEQLKGSMSQQNCPNPAAFERGNYMKALTAFAGKPI